MEYFSKQKFLWEQGSDFHLMTYQDNVPKAHPWANECFWGGTGRDLFLALIRHGVHTHGWRRLWIPAYFCKEVTRAFLTTGININIYSHGPEDIDSPLEKIDFLPYDVLLVVNYFGIVKKIKYCDEVKKKVSIIEDHTHDPWSDWSYTSNADWCIASLRKVLPLPDGGVLWSPSNHQLPAPLSVTSERKIASLEKTVGMSLKFLYLSGNFFDKKVFREFYIAGEKDMATGDVSGMSDWAKDMLSKFPIDDWREKRRINHRCLCNNLSKLQWVSVLGITENEDNCPFAVVLVFDKTGRRDFIYDKLIHDRIYPAILWPLEDQVIRGIPQKYVDLSRRILSIHCDMRYNERDMIYVGAKIRKFGTEYNEFKL